ncbi:MAG: ABC transporter ATP-binding protein [Rickettsiales bacterium]
MGMQRYAFFFFFITSLVTAFSASIWPFITGYLIDNIAQYDESKHKVFASLGKVFLLALGFWMFIEITSRIQGIIGSFLYPRFESNIRMKTFQYVNHHSQAYFSNHLIGSIANRIADLPRSCAIVIDFTFNNLMPFTFAILISAALFAHLHSVLGGILILWLMSHLFICGVACSKAADLAKVHFESRAILLGKLVDTLVNHLNVKLYSKHDFEMRNIRSTQDLERSRYHTTLMYIEKIKITLSVLALVGISGIFYLSIHFWQLEEISLGDLIFVLNTVLNLLALAWATTVEMTYLFRELGVVKQALKIVKDPIEMKDSPHAKGLKVKKGKIEFKKVTFEYKRNDNVFKEKTLTIQGGQKIGLVGFSGSGKTTFAQLLMRLFEVKSGQILIDGQDIKKVTLKSLRDNIALIPQEPILFHRSIRENIMYAKEEATEEELIDACIKANAHQFIMNLEHGYDTNVGEKGSKISGGQKQRIAIARAILQNAPILVMDEATSALDTHTEKQIQQSIKMLTKNKTAIIIAHRLSTLKEVDRILVFNHGTIIEDGSHDELLKKEGYYAELWRMQAAGVIPNSVDKQ